MNKPEHPIRTYCESREMFQADFARAIGVTPGVVSHYIAGVARPSAATARRIVAFTGGKISLEDLFNYNRPERHGRGRV